jgi:uncharacterized iron-regulated membrane protein
MDKTYEVQVWHEEGAWRAEVYVVNARTGERLDELNTNIHHDYLGNVMSYVAQAISDYEREAGK